MDLRHWITTFFFLRPLIPERIQAGKRSLPFQSTFSADKVFFFGRIFFHFLSPSIPMGTILFRRERCSLYLSLPAATRWIISRESWILSDNFISTRWKYGKCPRSVNPSRPVACFSVSLRTSKHDHEKHFGPNRVKFGAANDHGRRENGDRENSGNVEIQTWFTVH